MQLGISRNTVQPWQLQPWVGRRSLPLPLPHHPPPPPHQIGLAIAVLVLITSTNSGFKYCAFSLPAAGWGARRDCSATGNSAEIIYGAAGRLQAAN